MISFNKLCYLLWVDYLGLKMHFNGTIDWELGRKPLPSWTADAFLNRTDKQAFAAFVDFVPDPRERVQRLISTFIKDRTAHITTAHHMPDDIAEFHTARLAVVSALNYHLGQDLDTIAEYCYNTNTTLVELLSLGDSHTPAIVRNVNDIGINLESLSVLDQFFGFTRFESVSPLWNKNRLMIRQYGKLLKYDTDMVKHKLKSLVQV